MIFESSVQAVIDISRIEEVVRDYVNLRPRGSNLTGLCPFHKEKLHHFRYLQAKISINVLVAEKREIPFNL